MRSFSNTDWIDGLKGADNALVIQALQEFIFNGLRSYFSVSGKISEADLADLTQESTIKIINSIDSFHGNSKFTTWAMKIAVNTTFSAMRKKQWQEISLDALLDPVNPESDPLEISTGDLAPEKEIEIQQAMHMVNTIIKEKLTPKQQKAFLAMLAGMPLSEIASKMDSNRNAIYKLIHDTRIKIKKHLEEEGWRIDSITNIF